MLNDSTSALVRPHSDERHSIRFEVAVSEFVLMVEVLFDSALAKGSEDGKVLLHGEL